MLDETKQSVTDCLEGYLKMSSQYLQEGEEGNTHTDEVLCTFESESEIDELTEETLNDVIQTIINYESMIIDLVKTLKGEIHG